MAKTDGLFTVLIPVPMLHPHLFEARAYTPKGRQPSKDDKKSFSATAMFDADSEELKALKEHCANMAKAKWPGVALKEIRFPFKRGDKAADKRAAQCKEKHQEPDGEFQRGKVLLQSKSTRQPILGVINGKAVVDLDTANEAAVAANKSKFYFGAECLFEYNFACVELSDGEDDDGEEKSKRFVTAYLNRVVSTGRGKALGASRKSNAEAFKGYRGSVSAVNPASDSDEIPY